MYPWRQGVIFQKLHHLGKTYLITSCLPRVRQDSLCALCWTSHHPQALQRKPGLSILLQMTACKARIPKEHLNRFEASSTIFCSNSIWWFLQLQNNSNADTPSPDAVILNDLPWVFCVTVPQGNDAVVIQSFWESLGYPWGAVRNNQPLLQEMKGNANPVEIYLLPVWKLLK